MNQRLILVFTFVFVLFPITFQQFVSDNQLQHDEFTLSGDENAKSIKYIDFMSGGLKRIFWSFNWQSYKSNYVNNKCIKSVIQVQNELHRGSSDAFAMLDASSSTSSGLLTGSFASLGDFDQCLTAKVDNIDGNYCLLEISLKDSSKLHSNKSVDGSLVSVMPLLDFFLPRMSICVPNKCNENEILNMVTHAMSSYPFKVTEKINCQTLNSSTKMKLSKAQVVSILFVTIMLTLTVFATVSRRLVPDVESNLIEIFSVQSNARKLFCRTSNQVTRNHVIDRLKVVFSLMFISMHAIGGTDNPFSPLLISKMSNALRDSSRPELQIFFSENLAEIMFFLTGYVTITSIVEFMKKLTINRTTSNLIFSFLFSKWLRVGPLVFSLLALEFIWPLISSGPLYPEASKFILTNCHNYWWSNVLLIANWYPSIEKCCPQLFHSCVDFQLTFIAIGLFLILKKSTKAGLLTALALFVASLVKLYSNAVKYSVIPNYVSNGASLNDRMKYIDVIQLPTYSHLPAYVLGVICAFKTVTRKQIIISRSLSKLTSYLCFTLTLIAVMAPVIHNSSNLLTKSLVPLYIILQKVFYVFALLPVLLPSRQVKGEFLTN